MEKLIYLDHGATTRVDERVLNKMIPYYSLNFGNPSSVYFIGRRNKRVIEEARQNVASCLGAKQKEIYFTSCGSESDNLALKGVAYANSSRGKHIITSKIEHSAILNTCATLERQGFKVSYLNVDCNGVVNLEELENSITQDTILISIMFANNEIGTIEPIEKISQIAKRHNVYFHTDAVQAVGNVRINVDELGIDLLSMSAHKFYGPKGVGALYVRDGINFERIQDGGGQEKGKRSGTENVAGIVGLCTAIQYAYKEFDFNNTKVTALRNYFINNLIKQFNNVKINGDLNNRLPGNINVSFDGIDGEQLLLKLDEYGICASSASACSTGSSKPSHVLTAIGLTKEQAAGTVRFTLGKENTQSDIDYTIRTILNTTYNNKK
jgi:cysteine desulfurase